jgi:hypothetical protein
MNAMDKYMNEVIWYGGFPMRRGDVILHLDRVAQQVARATGRKSWLSLRDAGLMGNSFYNDRHPMPEGTEPITLQQLYEITGIEEEA